MIQPKYSEELWAVVHEDGKVAWTRGGSSSSRRPMVYDSEERANAILNNHWIKQAYPNGEIQKLSVKKIYG